MLYKQPLFYYLSIISQHRPHGDRNIHEKKGDVVYIERVMYSHRAGYKCYNSKIQGAKGVV